MHCRCDFFRFWPLLVLILASAGLTAYAVSGDAAWRELGLAPLADFNCRIAGVADLPSFASVLGALRAAPKVSDVVVREVDADSLMLRLKARGNEKEFEHRLANDRLQASAPGGHGALEYRYQAAP